MSRTGLLILLGVLTALTPYSGLPITVRTWLAVICGIGVLSIGISLRAHEAQKPGIGVE